MDPNQGGKNALLGFEYQLLYGLHLLMKSDENIIEYVEKYEDLTIETEDGSEYSQIKSTGNPKIIKENTPEFWNTLRNWCINISKKNISLDKSKFIIVTMNHVDKNSFLYFLKPEINRPREAYDRIHQIGKNPTTQDIKNKYYPAFKKLNSATQFKLIQQISILDNAPTIEDIKRKIKTIIEGYTNEEFVDRYYTDLLGWWRNILQEKLSPDVLNKEISWNDLSKIRKDLRNKYRKQILLQTITEEDVKNSITSTNNATFVKQLSTIAIVDNNSIWDAKIDYETTKRQNNVWIEINESYDENIKNFENRLKRDYSNKYNFEKNTITKDSNEQKKVEWGQNLYRWAMYDQNWTISDSSTDSYKRGVFHILADIPRIGWHPYYEEELEKIKDV